MWITGQVLNILTLSLLYLAWATRAQLLERWYHGLTPGLSLAGASGSINSETSALSCYRRCFAENSCRAFQYSSMLPVNNCKTIHLPPLAGNNVSFLSNGQDIVYKQDFCQPGNPCQSDGTCVDGATSYSCMCAAGYTGTNCQSDINECGSNPCMNYGSCNDHVSYFSCNCDQGYTGAVCENDINECGSNPCMNLGSCTDHVNSYSCTCAPAYTGYNCENTV